MDDNSTPPKKSPILLIILVSIGLVIGAAILVFKLVVESKLRETQATRMTLEFRVSLSSYHAEYRNWPLAHTVKPGDDLKFDTGGDSEIVSILLGDNTRGILFYSFAKESAKSQGDPGLWIPSGNPAAAELRDYWGNLLNIAIDTNGDGNVTTPTGSVPGEVAVWSVGKDKQPGTADDIISVR